MRIEVLIGSDDPIVFPLKLSKVSLGSSHKCDIVINSAGVSRKHILILTEGHQYFVVDQGSTNGSFISEERLIPGRKTEFTSFFPVRLGANVLLSLLSDEEALDARPGKEKSTPQVFKSVNSDKTSVLSLKSMKKASTGKLVKKRDIKRKTIQRPPEKKRARSKKSINFIPFLAVMIFLGAAAYNLYFAEKPSEPAPVAEVGQVVTDMSAVPSPEEVKPNPDLIPDDELVPKTSYDTLRNNMKCTIDIETHLCELIPSAAKEPFGVSQVGLNLHVMLDGTAYLEEARKLVKPPIDDSPVSLAESDRLIKEAAVYLFLLNNPVKLNLELLKDMRLFFALYEQTPEGPKVAQVLAILPKVFNEKESFVMKENLSFIRSNGISALKLTEKHYKTY
jgi:pSer/pThr/pTyr-binding forkhead associated (FHA) protein